MIREAVASDREALATILYRASRDVFPLAGIERVDAAEFDRQTAGESILVAEKDDR
ncbi:MAG TPA: GNAT family N-acetyltransferase, partial [Hyphomonas sp.]|nr:GNAT family N-acetyltransferase [Hyphomonas sp.]HBX95780.1 GNAT family N-acetyltransferase [Hyphomonas sp.]